MLLGAVGLCGCAGRTPFRIVLPDLPATSVAELTARYPLATGQTLRAERLGATANVSYHFVQLAPGAGERPHVHARHDLVVTVLRGSGAQWIRDQPLPMKQGDSAVIPAGTPHRFVNGSDGVAAALVIFAPPYDGGDQVLLDAP
ncbi:MAG TPA: cupin domain-containing protein [Candidatus Kryptonia bacterium]|nr:cupin domain-containing protein [Candidatus Kryptonia bacterium]